ILFAEKAEREPFFARLLLGEPRVRDGAQLGEDRRRIVHDLEAASLRLDLSLHLAHPFARSPLEREALQRNASLLTDLLQRQAEVKIEMEVPSCDFVEDRPAGVQIAQLAKFPDQL